MEQRDFKGIWIPKAIWLDKRLGLCEKYYLSLYQQFPNNKYVTTLLINGYSRTRIIQAKNKLIELGFIQQITDYKQAKEIVLKNKNTGFTCEWCGCKTNAIQEHHYPIPKSKGGTKIVRICPNCHYEYHLILKEE